MFVVVYRYQVPAERTRRYILYEKQVAQVYLERGCLGIEVYRDAGEPERWMEVNRFRDRQHYEEFVAAAVKDPRIEQLSKEFASLLREEERQPEKRAYFRML